MSILFEETIMHMLDISMDMPVLSKGTATLNDEIESMLTKHIINIFEDHSVSKATFNNDSEIQGMLATGSVDFIEFSSQLARTFYSYMQTFATIPSGDLIVLKFKRDGHPYMGILKFNYKEEFTHWTEQGEKGEVVNTIIKHKSIFPSSKVQEAFLIKLDTYEALLLDQSKERYMNQIFDCTPSLTLKQKIKVIERVVTEAVEENFEDTVEGVSFAKYNIAESIATTNTIMIDKVIEETFSGREEIIAACKEKFEAVGLVDEAVELPKPETVGKKYSTHKLKTNTGIELKLPTQMLSDPRMVEFINNPDGTLSIMIKNVSAVINK